MELYVLYYALSQITQPYLVGGCVRDMLLGKEPKDYDICIPPVNEDILLKILCDAGFSVKETGIRFLVYNASKNGNNFELAFFRKDNEYINGKLTSVSYGDLISDANRRDFTINALYFKWNISRQKDFLPILSEGDIIDPTGKGIADIKTRTLRFVGKPKDRIKEDPMRVFRFYRFLSTKNLIANPKSIRAVREMFSNSVKLLSDHGGEGIREELEKL